MNKLVKGLLASLSLLCSVSAYAGFQSDSYDIYQVNVDGKNGNDLVFIAREKWVFVGTSILSPIRFFDGESFTLLNNGQGGYSISYSYHGSFNTNNYNPTTAYSVTDVDLDGDGHNDLLLKPSTGTIIKIYADNSAGTTAPESVERFFAGISTDGLTITDVSDIDGGPALLLSKNDVSWLVDGDGKTFNATRSHSPTNAVGSLKGDFTVSQGGAATYHLPIELTPGPGQRKPSVSVNYDSQSGNGLLGMGWNLSATEQINRCQSKEPGSPGVAFTASDTLCLNGDELKFSHVSDGDSILRKRIDDGTLVRITGTNADGPTKFLVYSEEGTVKEFGYTTDSQTAKPDDVAIRKWYLNKVYWLGGASYSLKYSESEAIGEVLLSQIDYGSHSVRFAYEERPDRRYGYQTGGAWFGQTKRLKSIATQLNGSNVFRYTFFYGYNTKKDASYLSSIQQCAGDECLEPLAFDWELPTDTLFSSSSKHHTDLENTRIIKTGDVDGDGRTDLVGWYPESDKYKRIKLYRGSHGFNNPYQDLDRIVNKVDNPGTESLHLIDEDTDGILDIVWHDGFDTSFFESNEDFGWGNGWRQLDTDNDMGVEFHDVNGDGVPDLLNYGDPGDASLFVHAGKLGGGYTSRTTTVLSTKQAHAFGDINGDGKTDLVVYPSDPSASEGKFGIRLGGGGAYTSAIFGGINTFDNGTRPGRSFVDLQIADMNGDGLGDLLVTYQSNHNQGFYYHLADGKGGFLKNKKYSDTFVYQNGSQLIDINGDGRTDRIFTNGYKLARLDGTFGELRSWNVDVTPNLIPTEDRAEERKDYTSWRPIFVTTGEVNGDGASDLLVSKASVDSYDNILYADVTTYFGASERMVIRGITNTSNENTNIDYSNMTSSVYKAALPTQSEQGIGSSISTKTWLVRKSTTPEGSTYYRYGGAQFSKQYGYLGFQMFTSVTDRIDENASNKSGRNAIASVTYLHQSENLLGRQYQVYKRIFDYQFLGIDVGISGFQFRTYSGAEAVYSRLMLERDSNGNVYAEFLGRALYESSLDPYESGAQPRALSDSGGSSTSSYASTYDIAWNTYTLNNGIVRPRIAKEQTTFYDPTYTSTTGDGHIVRTEHVDNEWQKFNNGQYVRLAKSVATTGSASARRTVTSDNFEYLLNYTSDISSYHKQFKPTSVDITTNAGGDWAGELTANSLATSQTLTKKTGYTSIGQVEWTEDVYPNGDSGPKTYFGYDSVGSLSYTMVHPGTSLSIVDGGHRGTITEFDPGTGFLMQSSDLLENVTQYREHDPFGNARLERTQHAPANDDEYWLETTRTYDSWGRLTSETLPTGAQTTIAYKLCSAAFNGCVNNAEYRTLIHTHTNQGSDEYRYFDERGLETKKVWEDFGAGYAGVTKRYDSHHRLVSQSLPTKMASLSTEPSGSSATYRYDVIDRVVSEVHPSGYKKAIHYDYPSDGTVLKTMSETIDAGVNRTTIETYDALDRLTKVEQPNGAVTQYTYDLNNNATKLWYSKATPTETNPEASSGADRTNSHTVTRIFDAFGNMVSETDPSKGTTTYKYTAFGEVYSERSANGIYKTFLYDQLGRVTTEKVFGPYRSTTCYRYDRHAENNYYGNNWWAVGQLVETRFINDDIDCTGTYSDKNWVHKVEYSYNQKGQLIYMDQFTAGAGSYGSNYVYDTAGRLVGQSYPGGTFSTSYAYDSYSGSLKQIKDGSRVYKEIVGKNAYGQVTQEKLGSSIVVNRGYDTNGRPTSLSAASGGNTVLYIEDYQYDYEGKLKHQLDHSIALNGQTAWGDHSANYHYDDLAKRQLTSVDVNGVSGVYEYQYDALGNKTYIKGVGELAYSGANKLMRVGSGPDYQYDSAGNVRNDGTRLYNNHGYSSSIYVRNENNTKTFMLSNVTSHQPVEIIEGSKKSQFLYGPGEQLLLRRDINGSRKDTWYFQGMELLSEFGKATERRFDVATGVNVSLKSSHGGTRFAQYQIMDHQGSVLMTLNDDGVVKQRLRYKPFGATEVVYSAEVGITGELFTWGGGLTSQEGYTGHHTLGDFDLIHMGGRVYNPVIGRFFQPDVVIQAPRNVLSYNRYVYAWNNPGTYTDPSGYALVEGTDTPNKLSDTEPTDASKFYTANPINSRPDKNLDRGDGRLGNSMLNPDTIWSQIWNDFKNDIKGLRDLFSDRSRVYSYYWKDAEGNLKHYYVIDTRMCSVSLCDPNEVFDELNKRSIPFTDEYGDGYHELFGGPFNPDWAPDFLSPNPILHTSNQEHRISDNIAYESHIFDGYVRHAVTVTSNGTVRVTTIGAGPASNKYHAALNNFVGIHAFKSVHKELLGMYN